MNSQVSIAKCEDYQPALVQEAVRKSVALIGGMSSFVKPGSKVLLKPNLLMAKEPEYAIDTHPEVLRAAIKLLKEIDCKVYVGDGPSVWGVQVENVDEVYRVTGTQKVCQEEGVELVKFDKRRWRGKFPLTIWLDECEYLVSLPKFKTHEFTLMTGAVKNLFGLVSGTYKTELHKNHFQAEDFAGILVDIFAAAKPSLTIVDGITAMEGEGPATGGTPRHLGLVLASADCVAMDAVLAKIMGVEPFDVLSTREAARRGLGNGDLKQVEIKGEKLEQLSVKPFVLPPASWTRKIPSPMSKALKKLVRYYPYALRDKCIRCRACVDACPKRVIILEKRGIVIKYSGCIACFCCSEACPAAAIKVRKSLFARLIGL